MGVGIGIGSFVDGFARGLDITGKMDERRRAAQRFEQETALIDEQKGDRAYARDRRIVEDRQADTQFATGLDLAAEQKGDRAYARQRTQVTDGRVDAAYDRAESGRVAVEGISRQAGAEFDAKVAGGQAKPEQWAEFWSGYALPKLEREMAAQGNLEAVASLREWGKSEDAIKGGKLFSSALLKAQSGDPAGALSDAIAAGRLGGYIADGYEVTGSKEFRDGDSLLGYRLSIKLPDGKSMEQDVAVGDLPSVIATYLNPDTAWQSQMTARANAAGEQAKADREVDTYTRKKVVDAAVGVGGAGGAKARGDAIEALRKRMDGGLSGKDATFDSLARAQQEKLIAEELALQSGQGTTGASGTGQKAVFDSVTGQVVDTRSPSTQKTGRAVGVSSSPKAQDRLAASDPRSMPATADAERGQLLAAVPDLLKGGATPVEVVRRLQAAGIAPEQWPLELQMVGKAVARGY